MIFCFVMYTSIHTCYFVLSCTYLLEVPNQIKFSCFCLFLVIITSPSNLKDFHGGNVPCYMRRFNRIVLWHIFFFVTVDNMKNKVILKGSLHDQKTPYFLLPGNSS